MAYRNLYNPLSQFVDPGSTEIADLLRERYLSIYSSADATGQALAELPVANFNNDQQMYRELYSDTQSELDNIANRGDYENMFLPVSKLARKYKETATPLQNNYQRYMDDLQEKKDLLDEGKITMSDYEGWLRKSKMKMGQDDYEPYMGLTIGEDGRVNRNSYYNATPVAQYVDVNDEILTALNKLPEIKRGGAKVKRVLDPDSNGLVFAIEEQGQIVEYVPPEVVDAVTANVLNRPDISAYMEQSADFGTLDMPEAKLNQIIARGIQQFADDDSETNRPYINQLTDVLQNGSAGMKRRAAKSLLFDSSRNNYMQMARASRQPSAYGGSSSITYESALTNKLAEINTAAANEPYTPVIPGEQFTAPLTHIQNEMGQVTQESVGDNITALENENLQAYAAMMEAIPELQAYEQMYGTVNLAQDNAVDNITTRIMTMINPDANEALIRQTLQRAVLTQQHYRSQIAASEQMIADSYEGFAEGFMTDVLSDIAIDLELPAENMAAGFAAIEMDGNYSYDEASNSVSVTPGEPTEGSREAFNLATLAYMIKGQTEATRGTLQRAGIDANDALLQITQQMFGVGEAEAEEMISIASTLDTSGLNENEDTISTSTPYGPIQSVGAVVEPLRIGKQIIATGINQKASGAYTASNEFLNSKNNVQYTTGATVRAIGDRDGELSDAVTGVLKNASVQAFTDVPVLSTQGISDRVTEDMAELTLGQLFADDPDAKINAIRFTSYFDPVTRSMRPGLILDIKGGGSGAKKKPDETAVVPYDQMIFGFNPEMDSMIMNNYQSPGGFMANAALATMLSYPSEYNEQGVIFRDNIEGREIEIEFVPAVQPLQEEGLSLIAGLGSVILRSRGAGVEDQETRFDNVEEFIALYNAKKQTSNK